jgi:hypothetical protein
MKWWQRGLFLAGALNAILIAAFIAGAILDQRVLYSFGSLVFWQFIWLTALADAAGLGTVGTCFVLCELSVLGWILVPMGTAITACLYLLGGRLSLKWWPA